MPALLCLLLSLARAWTDLELACLQALYADTGGVGWYNSDGWVDPAANPCVYFGISCNDAEEIVTIELIGNNLEGVIPSCLTDFHALTHLSLSHNRLDGPLPDLPSSLTYIHVGSNRLTSLPSNLCSLPSLEAVKIDHNSLLGLEIPNCLLHLTELRVHRSGLAFPKDLKKLFFSGSRKRLLAAGCDGHLLELVPPFEPSRTVWELDLTDVGISSNAPLSRLLNGFPLVRELYLGGNNLTGVLDFKEATLLKNSIVLTTLNLGANNMPGVLEGVETLRLFLSSSLPFLYAIDLSHNRLTGVSPTLEEVQGLYSTFPSFYALNLNENPFFCAVGKPPAYSCKDIVYSYEVMSTTHLRFFLSHPGLASLDQKSKDFIVALNSTFGDLNVSTTLELDDTSGKFILDAILPLDHSFNLSSLQVRLYWSAFELVLTSSHPKNDSTKAILETGPLASDTSPQKLQLDVFGASKCPYFAQLISQTLPRVYLDYPQLLEIAKIRFLSLVEPAEHVAVRGYSMHGSLEVIVDYYCMCLQDMIGYDAGAMFEFFSCIYAVNTDASIELLDQCQGFLNPTGLDGQTLNQKVTSCLYGDRAIELVDEAYQKQLRHGIAYSPTIFLEDTLFCIDGISCAYEHPADGEDYARNIMGALCEAYEREFGVEYPNCTVSRHRRQACGEGLVSIGSWCVRIWVLAIICVGGVLLVTIPIVTTIIVILVRRARLKAQWDHEARLLEPSVDETSSTSAESVNLIRANK
ncbi:Leucine-rich repeat protein [Giardia muris]|uniref:Leucine-rich repeat protein n=1 Tax=Giardia muris TaxID=5742 RepID=A0A4Z1SX23_GIAMU|nr:Leucine-rich repeat protein [Giardia muris]|eukprot:TNJ26263.1 Leucine-rich repeat protein [Giardia muris]